MGIKTQYPSYEKFLTHHGDKYKAISSSTKLINLRLLRKL
uniref:Uncharacterized protein n=1 Tax=Nelumbo nucifera TaxID=4432 RepID=A0A822YCM1_NELNU|nr:TPA_asm: hypothetical protein HUJ06_031550 [Nelumbo nucifera]